MFKLFYNNQEITEDIRSEVYTINYADYTEGSADSLEISITDPTQKWLNNYYPKQGASLEFALQSGDDFLKLGKFYINEISYSIPPYTLRMKALSAGLEFGKRTVKAKSFVDTDLNTIVNFFAKKLKLKLVGTVEPIKIKSSIQYGERDLEYLKRIANQYNYFFKIHQDNIIFSQNKAQQSQVEVIQLTNKDIISIALNDYIADNPAQVNASSFNSKKKIKISTSAKSTTANNNNNLQIIAPSDTSFDALQNQANSKVYYSDSQTKQGTITLIGNGLLVAGQNIKLNDFYNFNGIYLIKSASHKLSEQGFISEIEVRFLK